MNKMRNIKSKIKKQLAALKEEVLRPRIVARQEMLTWAKKLQFALGLFLPRGSGRTLFRFSAAGFMFMLLLAALPFYERGRQAQKQILGAATSGFEFLQAGQAVPALESFKEARDLVAGAAGAVEPLLKILPPGRDLDHALAGGYHAAEALRLLAPAAEGLQRMRPALGDQTLYLQLRSSFAPLAVARQELAQAHAELAEINPNSVPEGYRQSFLDGGRKLKAAEEGVSQLLAFRETMLRLLGGRDKTYLLVFQNNSEVRPTGGFLGTYGLLSFRNGAAYIDRIESIYVLDGQLRRRIIPPFPMQRKLTESFGIRDSNWFVDFPASSRKMLGFLEEEAGVAADGVISFTPDVFERLLALTGPIAMPEYGEVLTAENFRRIAQEQTSVLYDRRLNQPKKFLADFAPRLLAKLGELPEARGAEFLDVLVRSIAEKHLLMFSLDNDIQQFISRSGAGGELRRTVGDYLAVIHSNLGGGKTDAGITQRVEKQVAIDASGQAVVTLRITRTHNSYAETLLAKNLDFMRVFVPEGSRLISVSGFDNPDEPINLSSTTIGDQQATGDTDPDVAAWEAGIVSGPSGSFVGRETGYTFFAGWMDLLPGETKTVELRYILPFRVDKTYSFLLQKQAGAPPFDFYLQLEAPRQWRQVFSYPEEFPGLVDTDRFYGVVWQ